MDALNGNLVVRGNRSGSGALTIKANPGRTVSLIGGGSGHTGNLLINTGRVNLGSNGRLNSAQAVGVAAGATLEIGLFGFASMGSLSGGGTVQGPTGTNERAAIDLHNISSTTFAGNILGNIDLAKLGPGTQTLSGNNTFGLINIIEGTLAVSNANALGTPTVGFFASDNGALLISAPVVINNPITIHNVNNITGPNTVGTTDFNTGANSEFAGDLIFARDVVLQAGSTNRTTFSGRIFSPINLPGPNGITITSPFGPGRRIVFDRPSGLANFFGLDVTIDNDAVLQLGVANSIGNRTVPDTAAIIFNNAGSTLRLAPTGTGDSETVGTLKSVVPGAGVIDMFTGTAFTLAIGADNESGTYSGTITDSSGALSIKKVGGGSQVISGNNTYTGTTQVSAGTLRIGANERIHNSSDLSLTGGTFDLNGFTETVNNATIAGGVLDFGGAGAVRVNGQFDVENGSTVNTTWGNVDSQTVIFGFSIVAAQNASVTGANSSWDISAILITGRHSNGTLTVNNGGHLGAATTFIGEFAGSNGHIIVGGSGASATADFGAGGVFVGGGSVGAGGTGSLNVNSGGTANAGNLKLWSNGTVTVNGGALETNLLNGTAGTVNIFDPAGGHALIVGVNNGSSTFGGVIQNAAGGPGSLKKTGTGTFTLAGANTHTGGTTVSAGTLVATHANALGSGPATLAPTGSDDATLLIGNNLTVTNTIVLDAGGSGTLTLGTSGSSSTIAGPIIGTGDLTITGGRVIFGQVSGFPTNTFSGDLTIADDTNLQLGTNTFIGNRKIPDQSTIFFDNAGSRITIASFGIAAKPSGHSSATTLVRAGSF